MKNSPQLWLSFDPLSLAAHSVLRLFLVHKWTKNGLFGAMRDQGWRCLVLTLSIFPKTYFGVTC